jgi:P4 family phage/plasmid primase-like protien
MANGIVDIDALVAGQDDYILPNSPSWFSMVSLPYAFDAEAICPRWEAFLEHNLEMDPERIKVLQEWAGYLLMPDTGEQRFLINVGEGANGKSVLTSALSAMLGEENVSNVPLEVWGDRFSRTDTLGKLLNAAGDCGEIDKAAEGYIKSFTSGDRMFFDRKGVSGLNCRPTARLMISCNNLPRFSDRSDGIWRRMLLIPWRVQIDKLRRIKGMDKTDWWQDSGELPGIFNWAIAGLHRLRSQKAFSESAVMEVALSEYKSDSNPARAFLVDTCEEADINSKISCKDLYESYCGWCRQKGHNYPLSDMQFGKEVKRSFPKVKRERETVGGVRTWFYFKLALDKDF